MEIKADIDIKSFGKATVHAEELTEANGSLYIPIDKGSHTWPQYSVIEAPKVGVFVSYGFNGDAYPDSKIVKISKTLKVITTESGSRYYRRKQTASWMRHGCWSMLEGHHDERNPHI